MLTVRRPRVRHTLTIIAATLLSVSVAAQPAQRYEDDKAAVVATVQKFFDTMTSRDVEGARRVLMPEGRMFSVREQNGQQAARASTVEDYLKGLGERKQDYRERMWNPEVRIHGGIASVWTPYDFWAEGKFSHCGIDIFDLVKTADGWKIASVTYTVERTGCAPSPLGPLK
jgi:hypothetical protein